MEKVRSFNTYTHSTFHYSLDVYWRRHETESDEDV